MSEPRQPGPDARRSRVAPLRRRRVAKIAARLRQAIESDPFLVRLPSLAELARLFGASAREVRYAMDLLVEQGVAVRGHHGHRVAASARGRPPRPPSEIVLAYSHSEGVMTFGEFLILGAESQCRRRGVAFRSLTAPFEDWGAQLRYLAAHAPAPDTGWLLMHCPSEELANRWLDAGRRFVLLDQIHPQLALPAVRLNHAAAAELAAAHLADLGHRRVVAIVRPSSPAAVAVARARPRILIAWVPLAAGFYFDDILAAMRHWIAHWRQTPEADRPTAVLVHSLVDALMFLDLCRAEGIAVPRALSVVAIGSEYGRTELPITLANSGEASELGRAAVELLMRPDVMADHPMVTLPASLDRPGLTTAAPPRARKARR